MNADVVYGEGQNVADRYRNVVAISATRSQPSLQAATVGARCEPRDS